MPCQFLALCLSATVRKLGLDSKAFSNVNVPIHKKNNDQTAPLIATRVSTKIMDDCFENFVGLVSTRKIGPAGLL